MDVTTTRRFVHRARVTIPIVGVARPGRGEQVLRICTGQKVGKEVPPLSHPFDPTRHC